VSQRRRSHPLPTEDAFIRYEVAFGLWGKCNGGSMWSKAYCVPSFPHPERVSFSRGGVLAEPAGQATTEFRTARISVPKAHSVAYE